MVVGLGWCRRAAGGVCTVCTGVLTGDSGENTHTAVEPGRDEGRVKARMEMSVPMSVPSEAVTRNQNLEVSRCRRWVRGWADKKL